MFKQLKKDIRLPIHMCSISHEIELLIFNKCTFYIMNKLNNLIVEIETTFLIGIRNSNLRQLASGTAL